MSSDRLRRLLAVVTLALLGAAGCIGAFVGTGIDVAGSAVTYPFRNGLFARLWEFDNDSGQPWRALEDDRGRDFGNELVGVAVSGGGSRSAYFLASVLDRLRDVPVDGREGNAPSNLLDEIDFLSSVSGGSLAATYYTLLRPDTSDRVALDEFFKDFRDDMRLDFESRSVGRTLFMGRALPLIFTHYHRGHVLAGVFDSNFFHDATFADLPPPGPRHPTLIVNATSYSRGSKFLLTRLPSARFNDSQLMRGLREMRLIRGNYTERHVPFENVGFDTLASDIGSFKLSYAVAASAGVPGILGPTVLKDHSRTDGEVFEELGDGGLYDNFGLETLVQLFASILEEHPGKHARIIVVDASSYFDAQSDRLEYTVADYADRVTSIAWLRTSDYTELLYRSLGGIDPKRLEKAAAKGRRRYPHRVEPLSLPEPGARGAEPLSPARAPRSLRRARRRARRSLGAGARLQEPGAGSHPRSRRVREEAEPGGPCAGLAVLDQRRGRRRGRRASRAGGARPARRPADPGRRAAERGGRTGIGGPSAPRVMRIAGHATRAPPGLGGARVCVPGERHERRIAERAAAPTTEVERMGQK
ncbi:MAG: patatin-like phospholipase family protein [Deltaproteobacteria bacterium]|nr:patatin-like phospholipase family protein [Deltaproteobacteria bacterium]